MNCSSTPNIYYSLANSIYLFAKAKSEELPRNPQELAAFLNQPVDPFIRENYLHQLRCLALQQVANPLLESLREGISNACDAEVIAQRESQPVETRLKGRTFTINDHGTGVGYLRIPFLFVDGKTSNDGTIFSLQKGLPNVAGRFGQGFKSLFYYLLYHWKEKPRALFTKTAQGDLEISIPLIKKDEVYRILFRKSPGKPVEVTVPLTDPLFAGKRKMVFWTRQGEDSFQLRFKEQKGELCWRLKPKFKAVVGTELTIESPLFEHHAQEILNGLSTLFAYLHPTPLLLNTKLVNSYVGMVQHHLPGCILFVSTAQSSEGGKLIIAEKGRPIVTLEQDKGPLVPQVMVLSFAALPLSHERSTLNWNSALVKQPFSALLNGIIQHNTWTFSQKVEFLNGLALALRDQYSGFNKQIINSINALLQKLPTQEKPSLLPDVPLLRRMAIPGALYIHPDYLKTPLWCSSTSFRTLENSMQPIGYYGTREQSCLFIHAQLTAENNPSRAFYHIQLAKEWLANFRNGEEAPSVAFPQVTWPKQTVLLKDFPLLQGNFFTEENCQQKLDAELVDSYLWGYEMKWRDDDPLMEAFVNYSDTIHLASFLFLCHFLFLERKEIVQKLIDANDSILEAWFVDFAINAACGNYNPSLPLTQALEKQAHFATALFDTMVALPTLQMQKCFIHYLRKNHHLEGTDLLASFNHFYSAIAEIPCSDVDYALSFFSETHAELERISPERIKAFFKRFPLPIQERLLVAFHHLKMDPNHYSEWTDQELGEFIEDLPIETSQNENNYYVLNPKYSLCFATLFFNLRPLLQALEHFRQLFRTIPKTHRALRQCLLPYILSDPHAIDSMHFQHMYANFDWAEFIQMLGKLINPKQEQLKIDQSIVLFDQTLKKITCFLDIFMSFYLDPSVQTTKKFDKFKQVEELHKTIKYKRNKPAEIETQWLQWIDAYNRLQPIQSILQQSNPSKDALQRAWMDILNTIEQLHFIPDEIRPWIYALYLSSRKPSVASANFNLPPITGEKGKLEEDPFVKEYLGSPEVARQKIQSARLQNSAPHFFMNELIKNAEEAGATEVHITTNLTPKQDELITVFADNGSGMAEKKELEALRTPGFTTKQRTLLNPNYGQGVFAVFEPEDGQRHLTVVTRKKEETEGHLHHFIATPTEITLQKQKFPKQKPGSTFILGKKIKFGPMLDLILFESNLIQATRYIEGITITLNGRPIKGSSHNSALCLTTHFTDQQGKPQEILGEVVRGQGALYAKGKKIGDLPSEYLHSIPPFLRHLLHTNGLSISLFMKDAGDQLMGRSQLVADPLSLHAIQALTLRLSFLAILHQWKHRALLNILSEDFFEDLRTETYPLTPQAAALKGYYVDPKGNTLKSYLETAEEGKEQATLLHFLEEYLTKVDEFSPEEKKGILDQINGQLDEAHFSRIDEASILTALLHCPLPGTSYSLCSLRSKIVAGIEAAGIVSYGEYTLTDPKTVDEIFEKLGKDLPLDLGPLVSFFKQHLTNALLSCEAQRIAHEKNPSSPCPELEQFLIRMAKQFFNREITIQPYTAADQRLAYVLPPANCIWINLTGKVAPFHNLVKDFRELSREEWMKRHIPTLVTWLEILTHEITHLEENLACQGETHEPAFYKKVAANLEPFFQKEGTPLALKILEEILSKPDVIMLG